MTLAFAHSLKQQALFTDERQARCETRHGCKTCSCTFGRGACLSLWVATRLRGVCPHCPHWTRLQEFDLPRLAKLACDHDHVAFGFRQGASIPDLYIRICLAHLTDTCKPLCLSTRFQAGSTDHPCCLSVLEYRELTDGALLAPLAYRFQCLADDFSHAKYIKERCRVDVDLMGYRFDFRTYDLQVCTWPA